MEKEKIRKEVQRILEEQALTGSGREVKDETTFREDLGGDSLDAVEVSMELEDAFNIQISDAEIESINTVGDIIELVNSKIS